MIKAAMDLVQGAMMQGVIDEHNSVGNALSLFIQGETQRNFSETPVLQVPGCSGVAGIK